MTQADSLTTAAPAWQPPYRYQAVETDTGVVYRKIRLTPADVIDRLPADATPAQQDSAVQAHFTPCIVAPSGRPDTLSLPGLKAEPFKVHTRPDDWQRGYFNDKPLFREDLRMVQPGMAGEPLPYELRTDDFVTGALLVSFLMVARIVASSRHMLMQQAKDFFYSREHENLYSMRTGAELRGQLFLIFQTCVVLGVLFFGYTQEHLTTVFREVPPYKLLGIDIGVCLSYYVLKSLTYAFVNWIFFDKSQASQWIESYLLVVLFFGLLLFPATLLAVYFDLSLLKVGVYFLLSLLTAKILLFYKLRNIFFAHKNGYLQLIVYFCTLEMLPSFVLWRTLIQINQNLVVIF